MFYLGLISFAASMLVMLTGPYLTIFQLIKRQTLLTKSTILWQAFLLDYIP